MKYIAINSDGVGYYTTILTASFDLSEFIMAAGKKGKTDGKSQPKGDGPKAGKGKEGKNAEQNDQKATKVKGAQNYWISHILVRRLPYILSQAVGSRQGC